jgi:hypothetical protein
MELAVRSKGKSCNECFFSGCFERSGFSSSVSGRASPWLIERAPNPENAKLIPERLAFNPLSPLALPFKALKYSL